MQRQDGRWRTRMRVGRIPLSVAAFAAVWLVGCEGTQNCTAMGDSSRLDINFESVAAAQPDQRLKVEVCVDDTCKKRTVRPHQHPSMAFGEDVITDDQPREVSVTILDETGQTVFDGASTVTPRKRQVNGQGCEPTTYVANVATSGPSGLKATYS